MRRRPTLKGVNTLSERFAPRLFRGISASDPADDYHPMLIGGSKQGDARGDVPSVHTLRLDPNNPHDNWARSMEALRSSPDKHRNFRSNPIVPTTGDGRHLTGEGKR